jgi:hypothetical protein
LCYARKSNKAGRKEKATQINTLLSQVFVDSFFCLCYARLCSYGEMMALVKGDFLDER